MRRGTWLLSLVGVAFICLLVPTGRAQEDARSIFREAIDALEQGDHGKAADLLDKYMAKNPGSRVSIELRNEAGRGELLRALASENEDLVRAVRKFLEDAAEGELKKRADPERIAALVEQLKSQDYREEFIAEQVIINTVGQYIFQSPEIVEVLSNQQKDEIRVRVIRLLTDMGPEAVLPLLELLALPEAFGRQNVAVILGNIGDRRALPYLKRIWEQDKDPMVKDEAAESIQKIDGQGPAELPPSPTLYLRDGNRYYYDDPTFVRTQYEEWLVWDFADGKLVSRVVPPYAYNEVMAEELCYQGLAVNPTFAPLWTLLLNTYYARVTEVEAALEIALEKSARGEMDQAQVDSLKADLEALGKARSLNSVLGAEGILLALDRSLRDGRVSEAVAACRALRDLPLSDSLLPVGVAKAPGVAKGSTPAILKAKGEPLIRGLFHADKRVRYAAANTIVRIHPRTEVQYRQQAIENLVQALGEKAPRLALVITGDSPLRNRFLKMLNRYHYLPMAASSLSEGRRRGLFFPPEDIFLIGEDLPDGKAHELIDVFKNDFRTSHIPILVIADPDRVELAEERYGDRADGVVPADIDEVLLKDRIDAIFEGEEEGIKSEADRIAAEAATSLAMIDPRDTIFDVKDVAPALRETLEKRPDVVRIPAMDALGMLRDGGSIPHLTQVFSNQSNDEAARVAAINALGNVLSAQKSVPPETFIALKEALSESASPVYVAAGGALGKAALDAKQQLELFQAERID